MLKQIEVEIPDDYMAEIKKAAEEADISVNSQLCVAIATWIALRNARGEGAQ